ncbi:MAG: helix-turn-helix domain-containing protein [Gordonibacter sp.]|uniref:helix-turn-helix domain-containing protein n=1 Tax=Gordonibacter sp. TaxID=1968902 RepID=UPI002FC8AB3A
MITVSDILALTAFENVRLVAPCDGGGAREVRNVGILDCPPDYNEYSVYMPRELILTNLGFAYGNPDMAEKSLLTMIRRDVAAIAIKSVYEPPISDLVRSESAARGVPLYLHDGAYYETVAYESLDLIRRDQEGLDKGRIVDELLASHDGDRTRKLLHGIAGMGGALVQCFALTTPTTDKCSFFATVDAVTLLLASVAEDGSVVESVSVCPYRERILALVSYGNAGIEEMASIEERCLALIAAAGNLRCGVGEAVRPTDGDLTVHQALTAADAVERDGVRAVRWADLHAGAFMDAARSNRLFMSASALYRSKLARYDDVHGTELMVTVEALVRAYGDVKTVADELHQHPNTVRYRVRKAKALLGMADRTDRELLYLLDLVFLPTFDSSKQCLPGNG